MKGIALALALAGCNRAASGGADLAVAPNPLVEARPYQTVIPTRYDAAKPTPLVVVLHGYGANGLVQAGYFALPALAEERGFLLAYPDGTRDGTGKLFWNATDACCDFANHGVDDVAYLAAVIDDMSARYTVDRKRVWLVGHSNGGYMANRLACDLAPRVAAIASLAGAEWTDAARCRPSEAVAVLAIHGDADASVPYAKGRESAGRWASRNGCAIDAERRTAIDLERSIDGSETDVEQWIGCRAGGDVALWTLRGGSHLPAFRPDAGAKIHDWLAAHPKP
jgi:polyhydroxybutyrate depolymerase